MYSSLVKNLLLFIALTIIAGCEPKEVPEKEANAPFCFDLEEIQTRGKLIALTDKSSSSYFVYKGTPIGFEYDLLKRFSRHIGVNLEMKVVENMDCVIDMLESGEGDVIAANYTVTKDRKNWVNFSDPILNTRQVLIQRLPDNWWTLSRRNLQNSLIADLMEIDGDIIVVRRESSFYPMLSEIVKKSSCPFLIEATTGKSTEDLIKEVADGKVKFTIADENVARLNSAYFNNIHTKTIISDSQHIAWAARSNSVELIDTINSWLHDFKETRAFRAIHMKYFKARSKHKQKVMSDFSSLNGKRISVYDDFIKAESERIGWDWRLVAALIKKESNFNSSVTSSRGAAGLMQLLPNTAAHFGTDSVFNAAQSISAGVSYLSAVIDRWDDEISDSLNLIKFVLASYNAGVGHVQDAARLTQKHGGDPTSWEDVSKFLLKLSDPEFNSDEVVKYGYCRGIEPVNHVEKVIAYWEHYKNGFD